MITPKIVTLKAKKLVGMQQTMSIANNKTGELWKRFMPRRKEITNNLTNDLISLQQYPTDYFKAFNPNAEFTKWAAVEVSNHNIIPVDMNTFDLQEGLYAVFDYKGMSSNPEIFQYIFAVWLPNSKYTLDNRPHFEVLGEKYKNNDPNSEEEIWIPVKEKV